MPAPGPPIAGKYRILVAEDDSAIARLVIANLNKAGFECRYAQDGAAAFKIFKEFDPHLVLTDIMMPGMSGHELTAKIREDSTVPIIMMTAADSNDNQFQGFKSGIDDYVAKPFNPQLLMLRVVANLRRVYNYDVAAKEEAKEPATSMGIPQGWAKCDACAYMAPSDRFATTSPGGERKVVCPRCGESSYVAFGVG
ncbi:MAG: response regulator transcription factor [Armatimonadota bacterium]|nr:response regulator transcription factor [Armatimonadota bacterium]